MPFIEEEEIKLMQEDLANAKLKTEEAEGELNKTKKDFTSFKKKSKITPILLGLLLGISLGVSYYFYTNTTTIAPSFTENEIAIIKNKENTRVLDSIQSANARKRTVIKVESGINADNLEQTIDEVATNTKGETMYSVQIGVLSKKKFPLLSSKTIPSIVTSKESYFKYSLGLFTTLKEAKKLKKELVKLGIKDAFVASYINGNRKKIHN